MSGNPSKSTFFEGGWVTFSEYLTGNRASSNNQCSCQKTRVIAVLCGIKISAVHHLVLSQYTRLTDGQTDGQTEFQQQYRALHYMQSHGKNRRPI